MARLRGRGRDRLRLRARLRGRGRDRLRLRARLRGRGRDRLSHLRVGVLLDDQRLGDLQRVEQHLRLGHREVADPEHALEGHLAGLENSEQGLLILTKGETLGDRGELRMQLQQRPREFVQLWDELLRRERVANTMVDHQERIDAHLRGLGVDPVLMALLDDRETRGWPIVEEAVELASELQSQTIDELSFAERAHLAEDLAMELPAERELLQRLVVLLMIDHPTLDEDTTEHVLHRREVCKTGQTVA